MILISSMYSWLFCYCVILKEDDDKYCIFGEGYFFYMKARAWVAVMRKLSCLIWIFQCNQKHLLPFDWLYILLHIPIGIQQRFKAIFTLLPSLLLNTKGFLLLMGLVCNQRILFITWYDRLCGCCTSSGLFSEIITNCVQRKDIR